MQPTDFLANFTPQTIILVVFYVAAAVTLAATVVTMAVLIFMKVMKLREALLLITALREQLLTMTLSSDPEAAALAKRLYMSLATGQDGRGNQPADPG